MLIPFGILAGAGAGALVPDYELIATTVLGTTATSFTFSSLDTYSADYKHLQIRMVARSNRAGNPDDDFRMRFNGVTTSSYASHQLFGNGSSVTSTSIGTQSSMNIGKIPAATATANLFGAYVIDLLDSYSTTKNKTARILSGNDQSKRISLSSGFLNNTSALSSVTLFPESGGTAFIANSRFSIYGIKG